MKVVDPNDPPADCESAPPQRTAQVIRLGAVTRHDIPAEVVLEAARAAGMRCVVVAGYDADGEEYFASSIADGADVLWLLERMKLNLLTITTETP